MERYTVNNYGGTGVVGLLGVAFVILKLTGIIDWSWWWVLAPFWLVFAVIMALIVYVVGFALFKDWQEARAKEKQKEKQNADN